MHFLRKKKADRAKNFSSSLLLQTAYKEIADEYRTQYKFLFKYTYIYWQIPIDDPEKGGQNFSVRLQHI